MNTEKRIVREQLDRLAQSTTDNLNDVAKDLGALTIVCSCLLAIIESQQVRIERLENALQNHLETTPRRR